MSDGRTPADGAMVYYWDPDNYSFAVGNANPAGNIQAHRGWDYFTPKAAEGPNRPVIIASLPGTCGAAIVEPTPGKPLRITLPAPRKVEGKVTIGGAAPTGVPGQIIVVAEYQDKGPLNPLLSLRTTADADGRFTLAGLTPGTYQVQATLDEIWLSETTTITVGADQLADLKLNIGTPGGPAAIVLRGPNDAPLVDYAITLDCPAGPLARQYWPAEWRSDGAGRVFIPPLEAGKHCFHIRADGSTHELTVPPLSANAGETVVKVRLAKQPSAN